MDLVEFLKHRLHEDKEAARVAAVRASSAESWFAWLHRRGSAVMHIVRHDPARVLVEVEAKQRILELHTSDGAHECAGGGDGWGDATVWERTCPTLRLMTLPYADHPNYDEAWRP